MAANPLSSAGGQAGGQMGDIPEVGAPEPEHEPLVRMSDVMEAYVRDTLARIALAPGSRVLEIGRGPLGALLPLSAAVGPRGVVVGLGRDEALDAARPILAALRVRNVHLARADLATLTPADVCPSGPFDLAYCHAALCDQTDVVAVLERIAAVVRPGGRIVVQEAVFTAPIPIDAPGRFVPAANLLINEWIPALLGTLGACWDVAERYSMLCQEVGLVEEDQRVFAPSLPAAQAPAGIAVYRDILNDVRPLLLRHDIATAGEIDRVLATLRAAREERYSATLFMHLQAQLVARVP